MCIGHERWSLDYNGHYCKYDYDHNYCNESEYDLIVSFK